MMIMSESVTLPFSIWIRERVTGKPRQPCFRPEDKVATWDRALDGIDNATPAFR